MSPNILFHLQFPPPDPPSEIPQIKLESFFESLDGWDIFAPGAGSVVMDSDKIILSSGGIAGEMAGIVERLAYPPGTLTWSKVRSFKLKARVDVFNDPGSMIYICTGNQGTNRRGFGFRFMNTTIRGFSKNGGAEQFVNLVTGLTPPYVSEALFEAVFTPGSDIKFYMDGDLKGTLTWGLPTGTEDAEWLIRLFVYSSVNVNHQISTSYVKAVQDL